MPRFSRSQLGVILLLGAVMMLLWAWRGHFGFPPAETVAPDKMAGNARPTVATVAAAAPPRSLTPVFVEVAGKVDRPGVYVFPQPPTLSQVLAQAGGAGPADKGETTLASGAKVEVGDAGRWGLGRMGGAQLLALGLALDLNRAGAEDLDALPGIGPALAQRIIAYRQDRGPFKKVDDLEKVSGIGPKKLEQLRAYVVVEDEINEK